MGHALIVAEHFKGAFRAGTFSAITFGRSLADKCGGELHVIVLGSGIADLGEQLAAYPVDKVHLADAEVLGDYTAEAWAQAIADVAKADGAEVIAANASFMGKDLMPRVAAKLEAGMASDVVAVEGDCGDYRFVQPMWAGNVLSKVKITTPISVLTVRATEFDKAAPTDAGAPIDNVSVTVDAGSLKARVVKFEEAVSERPDLTEAQVVISGGRGAKGEEGFAMIEELADLLGGAVGATRAVVDAGWQPNDLQVGQTGKVVAPQLYIAVGLSGAIQHLAGMKGSKVIVAINKDPEAPIFEISDYKLEADLFKAMPELIDAVKAIKG